MKKFDSKQQVFDFIYVIAMQDAVRQRSYQGERKWLWDLSKDETKIIRAELQAFIDNILKGKFNRVEGQEEYNAEGQKKYNIEFGRLARTICNEINRLEDERAVSEGKEKRDGDFTFGNAQKLINMLCKYFYILVYDNFELRTRFIYCHCPMDSILLKKVWEKRDEWNEKVPNKIITEKYFNKSWGNEDFEEENSNENILPLRYRCFQEAVRALVEKADDIISSIEFDYKEWE